MVMTDRLSRFPSRKENSLIEQHQNIQHISFTPNRTNIIHGALERDPILSTVYHLTLNGQPEKPNEVLRIAQQFWGVRDELSIEEGLLIKVERISIFPDLYDKFLLDLHEAHLGIEKNAAKGKSNNLCPGIDTDVTGYVNRCQICLQHKATHPFRHYSCKIFPMPRGKTLLQISSSSATKNIY